MYSHKGTMLCILVKVFFRTHKRVVSIPLFAFFCPGASLKTWHRFY